MSEQTSYQEARFDIAGLSIAGWYHGKGSGPLLLALHGWQDNADSFGPLANALPEQRLLAIDWPGHGYSSHVGPQGQYHFIDWADTLYQLVRQLNEPVILLGHSMGALVASVFAASFPEWVQKLVVIEGFGPISSEPEQAIELLKKSVCSREKLRRNRARVISLEAAITARMMAGSDLSRGSAQRLCLRNLKMAGETGGRVSGYHWRTDPKIKAFSPLRMTEAQAQAFVAGIQCPVLSIVGVDGPDFVKQQLQDRAHLVPQLQQVQLAGGHHLHMEHSAELAPHISAFVG